MRYLAIDYGARRLGLAICDESETFAAPHGVLVRQNRRLDMEALLQTLRGLGVQGIVFGLPRATQGGKGDSEDAAREFAAHLQQTLQEAGSVLQIEWWDERFSTREALNQMKMLGVSQKRGREDLGSQSTDARAAAVILQGFLDHRHARSSSESISGESGGGESANRVLDAEASVPEMVAKNELKDLF